MITELIAILCSASRKRTKVAIFTHISIGVISGILKDIYVEKNDDIVEISSTDSVGGISLDSNKIDIIEYDYDFDTEFNIARIIGAGSQVEIHYA